jgi:hypothetical protein
LIRAIAAAFALGATFVVLKGIDTLASVEKSSPGPAVTIARFQIKRAAARSATVGVSPSTQIAAE